MVQTSCVETVVSTAFMPGENPDNIRKDGNILDSKCEKRLGAATCEGCVFYEPEAYTAQAALEKICAHQNLLSIIAENGLTPSKTLMVGVTGDKVGFYEDAVAEGAVKDHKFGWKMTVGYNAFFARKSEISALGARLADCSFVEVSAELPDGDTMFGLIHMTRNNIQGDSALNYGPASDKSYVHAALEEATEHYGITMDQVRLVQRAKINQLDYTFKPVHDKETGELRLTAEQNMDTLFAGWFDQGLLRNTTNPNWKRGDEISPEDVWIAEYQVMTEHVIRTSGVSAENIDTANAIDPGIIESGHASNAAANDPKRSAHRKRPDARDAYLVIPRDKAA